MEKKIKMKDGKLVLIERNKYIKKSEIRGMLLVFTLVTFICSWLVIPNIKKDIDESQWCLDKLNAEFSEYNFISANFYSEGGVENTDYVCSGFYLENTIQRDGLREKVGQLNKRYILINEKDIEYLLSDNWNQVMLYGGVTIWLLMVICCCAYADGNRWWKYA